MKHQLMIPLGILAAAAAAVVGFSQQTAVLPKDEARRVEVLFLGAPTVNGPAHDPIERYRVIRKALGSAGINFTYTEDLRDLNREVLDQYDALLFYGNWDQHGEMDPDQEQALVSYVEDGGAFLPIHCASACFGASDAYVSLVGARFRSHGDGVFRTTIVNPDHPIMRGYESFEAWDETYVHDRHSDDRTVLQLREDEPWTWVRHQGEGRVFYTAYGHDMRCWDVPGFHELMRRAILWSVGEEVRSKWMTLRLPELEMEEMLLPGYRERRAITMGQKPLSPAESMKMAQVPVGYELSLFASEPDIVNPIYISWDERGRAYIVETVDYPNNLQAGNIGNDRIKIAEDTNGDGRADKFTVFADKLSIPTSMVFANGGVIITNGSEILFLKDSTGDDRADVREVLFSGFGMGDTHAGPSNLRYGPDNWIYGTVGYSGFNGTVGGEEHRFTMGAFRFKPDGSKLEYLQQTTNNTWGLGFTSDFDIMGSTANGNPSWFLSFPKALYDRAGLPQPRTPGADDNPKFFPSSMDIRQVDQHDRYTSAAAHSFYTAARFPEGYEDRIAFVCGPTGKLVGQFEVTPRGAGFVARQLPNNLYSSADGWSAPVHVEVGPDGAVWICDWYNIIIQHNPTPNMQSAGMDARNGRGNAYETPLRDVEHGRIYRVYPRGSSDDENPNLDPARPDGLVAGLGHSNMLWRLHAQRMIVENQLTDLVPRLRELVASGEGTHESFHAFHALHGLGALDLESITTALVSTHRGLRRAAIENAPLDDTIPNQVIQDGVISANDDRELAEIFAALTRLAPSEAIGRALHTTLEARLETILRDVVLNDGWQIAARHHAVGVLLAAAENAPDEAAPAAPTNLLPNPTFEDPEPENWTLRVYGASRPNAVELSVTPNGRNGGNALRIHSPHPADVGAGATVRVQPNTRYRLGGWVRTEEVRNRGGRGVMMNVHTSGADTDAVSGTRDWTEVFTEFTTGANQNQILVHLLFGGYGGSVGTAWFDDVYLHELNAGDGSGPVNAVIAHFASSADPAARRALIAGLAERENSFSERLRERVGSAPEVEEEMVRVHTPDPAVHERGAQVYSLTCIACHGPDGKGVPGAFPPLDGTDWVTGDPSRPVRIILHGLMGPIEVNGERYENVMPPHIDLDDAQIADVVTYIRQSWSNDAASVTEEQVREIRAAHADRNQPWTAADLN